VQRFGIFLIAAMAGLGLWMLCRLRAAQLARRVRSRSEERARRHERIARELHDTLLQDLQGLILRFQAAAERIPAEQGARAEIEAALLAADDVITQARDQAYGLRAEDMGDLVAALAEIVATTPFDPSIQIRLVVEGKPRTLDPVVAPEIARIVSEALFNIAQHARTPAAGITVGFESSHLAVQVRDYGVGIAGHVLAQGGKDGHSGMTAMRERAERIGGDLTVDSGPSEGTEITLTLPAELAFSAPMRRRNWISRLF